MRVTGSPVFSQTSGHFANIGPFPLEFSQFKPKFYLLAPTFLKSLQFNPNNFQPTLNLQNPLQISPKITS